MFKRKAAQMAAQDRGRNGMKQSYVVKLTPAMRAALDRAVKLGQWEGIGPAQSRMAETLCDSGLLCIVSHAVYGCTAAGELALAGKPKPAGAWIFTTPNLGSSRDVRRLRECAVCTQLGQDLPNHNNTTAHGACLVSQHGWAAIVEIDDQQFARFRAEDLMFLGVSLADVEAARRSHNKIKQHMAGRAKVRVIAFLAPEVAEKPGPVEGPRASERGGSELVLQQSS